MEDLRTRVEIELPAHTTFSSNVGALYSALLYARKKKDGLADVAQSFNGHITASKPPVMVTAGMVKPNREVANALVDANRNWRIATSEYCEYRRQMAAIEAQFFNAASPELPEA